MNEFFLNFGSWGWMSLGIVLMLLELFVPGTFMIWFGFGALFTGILIAFLAAIFGPLTAGVQILIFVVMSVLSVIFGFFVYGRLFGKNKESIKDFRTGAKRFIGQTFIVSEAIENGKGKVNVGDTVWLANADTDIQKGAKVIVTDVNGTILRVTKAD